MREVDLDHPTVHDWENYSSCNADWCRQPGRSMKGPREVRVPLLEIVSLRVEEPDKVVARHVFFAVSNHVHQNVVQHGCELRFQKLEAGKDRNAIAVGLPHVERFAFEKLPAVYEI